MVAGYYDSEDFSDFYIKNAIWKEDIKNHKMSLLMNRYFPYHYLINGNISEIARNFFDPLPKKLTAKDLCYISDLQENDYEVFYIKKWLNEFKSIENLGYNKLDFLYWENKMSNWAGNSKSISNLYNTVISPFNNRNLLNLLLSTNRKYRDKTFNKLYKELINQLNPDLNNFKINPTKKNKKISLMKKIGIYSIYRFIFFKLKILKLNLYL